MKILELLMLAKRVKKTHATKLNRIFSFECYIEIFINYVNTKQKIKLNLGKCEKFLSNDYNYENKQWVNSCILWKKILCVGDEIKRKCERRQIERERKIVMDLAWLLVYHVT